MYMTETEVLFRYRNMDELYDRVLILSELNDCPRRKIESIIKKKSKVPNDIKPKNRTRSIKDYDLVFALYNHGCSDGYIASKVGLRDNNIYYWRKANGLECNSRPGDNRTNKEEWDTYYEGIVKCIHT